MRVKFVAMVIRKGKLMTMLIVTAVLISSCNDAKKNPETVEIHLLGDFSNTQNPINSLYLNAIESFEKINPDIKVIVDNPGDKPSSKQNILELLKSDEAVDLIPLDANSIQDEALLLDLLPLSSTSSTGLDIYSPVLDSTTVNGSLFVLPYIAQPEAILFRKEAFDPAHVPYPEGDWTWEQFRDISKKIQTAQKMGSVLPYDPDTFEKIMASTGERMVSPDGSSFVGYLGSPEGIRTIQWMNDYYADDATKTSPMSSSDAGMEFNDRQAGMGLGNAFFYKLYSDLYGSENIGVASLPHFEDGTRANPVFFYGYGIARKSKNPQVAWKLLEYLALDKNEYSIEIAKYNLTTSESMAESTGQASDPIKSVFQDELNHSVKSSRDYPFVNEVWNDALIAQFQALMKADDKDIPDRLHTLAQKLDQELNRLKMEDGQQTESPS